MDAFERGDRRRTVCNDHLIGDAAPCQPGTDGVDSLGAFGMGVLAAVFLEVFLYDDGRGHGCPFP